MMSDEDIKMDIAVVKKTTKNDDTVEEEDTDIMMS